MLVEQSEIRWKRFAYEQIEKGKRFGEFTQKDFIQKVLDDAKQEFPTDKDATKMIEAEDRYHGTTYKKPFVDSDLWETLVEKWFKKWFGGENE